MEDTTKKFQAINLDAKVIESISKNKKVVENLSRLVDMAGGSADKTQGNLLYNLSSEKKFPPTLSKFAQAFVECVMSRKFTKVMQIDEGVAFLKEKLAKEGDGYKLDQAEFERASGVGINYTEEDIQKMIDEGFEEHKADITEHGYGFNFNKIAFEIKDKHKWADQQIVRQKLTEKQVAVLGEKPKDDGKRKKMGKKTNEEKKNLKINAPKDPEAEASTGKSITELIGRDCNIGANTGEVLRKHEEFTKGRILTRFPPEPNGYLHIGHAKAIRFNFTVAKEFGGDCYLRFDDTNPCKENQEFIDHIKKNVAWLGYKPWKVTASSDYFQELFDLAVSLIKKGKAYVCFQNKEQI